MNQSTVAQAVQVIYPFNTDQFAEINGVKSHTVRQRLCEKGSYYGIVPKKLANGRLAWPSVQVEAKGKDCGAAIHGAGQ